MCHSKDVTLLKKTGFQASIESYNGRWQEKVWNRFESAPTRWEIPADWKPDISQPLSETFSSWDTTTTSATPGAIAWSAATSI